MGAPVGQCSSCVLVYLVLVSDAIALLQDTLCYAAPSVFTVHARGARELKFSSEDARCELHSL